MPTFRHGRNAVLKVDDSGGTLRSLHTMLREAGLNRSVDLAETSAFGTFDKTWVVGMREGRIPFSGMFSAAAANDITNVLDGILGQEASVSFEYGPEGEVTGRKRYSGECYLVTYDISSPYNDMVATSGEFVVTGTVTSGVWP